MNHGIVYLMKDHLYHRSLRIGAVVTALLLVFQSGTALSDTQQFTAAVFNSLTTKVNSSEATATVSNASTLDPQWVTYALASFLFVLLSLLVLNYAFSHRITQTESSHK